MTQTDFIGRYSEMELLNNLWKSQRATFLILYGRRRVGKTRLLIHWLKEHSADGLYWVAELTSSHDQLRSFSQALYTFDTPDFSSLGDYSFNSWEQAFREVAKLAQTRRIALFIDEVTYLMTVNPDFIGVLQKAWDQWLSNSNLFLVLSGSQMGTMQRKILAYDAPLYGRATAQTELRPMPFWTTKEFFPDYSAHDRVRIYSVWGGIPAYWERLDPTVPFDENLRQQLLPSNMWMMDEPAFLLKDFINDPSNYVSILRGLAHGATTSGRLTTRTGLSKGHITSYLATLRETGFVRRHVPITEAEADSRRGRYYVVDPYMRFYYHYLAAYQSKLAFGAQEELLNNIKATMNEFVNTNTWRELCLEWLLKASAHGKLPLPIEKVGGFWHRNYEVDLVGIDRFEQTLVLSTCSWTDEADDGSALDETIRKANRVIPDGGEAPWRCHFIGFSASSWQEGTFERLSKLADKTAAKQGWSFEGIQLLELEEIDADLMAWRH